MEDFIIDPALSAIFDRWKSLDWPAKPGTNYEASLDSPSVRLEMNHVSDAFWRIQLFNLELNYEAYSRSGLIYFAIPVFLKNELTEKQIDLLKWTEVSKRISSATEEAQSNRWPHGTVIYFMRAVQVKRIKIGYSSDPLFRMALFQTGSPVDLSFFAFMPGGGKEEKTLHRTFADLHVHGEWFEEDERLLSYIKKNATECDL
jgi:hypothetical protein